MKVAVTGSHGLIGTALVDSLLSDGHDVVRVPRDERGDIVTEALAGAEAVVHLAGESIGAKLRWDDEHKRRVKRSRVEGTRRVAETLARQSPPPRVLVSASAIGYYGNRADELLDENAGPGRGFLAELLVAWEAATGAAADSGIRVARIRTGVVLDASGGILPKFLLPGRLGLGARFGSGRQWFSWITLDDEIRAIRHLIDDESLAGPVNLASPGPVTNAELVRTIGRVLHRPAVLVLPAFALRLALGREAADELLLTSQRVQPSRLEESGFRFHDPDLEPALRDLLGR